jgi:hypothetical protein
VPAKKGGITRPKRLVHPMYYDRLYVMLNKIHLYRKAKGISAELVLIMVEIEGENYDRPWNSERFYDYFQSAISNKLLKIENIKISSEEIENHEGSMQKELL